MMATKTGTKAGPATGPQASSTDVEVARQVHTLAQVLYGQLVSRYPEITWQSPPGPAPTLQAPVPMAGPVPGWMTGPGPLPWR